MKELLSKLSTYNLFNYLFPGVIFSLLTPVIAGYSFVQKDIVIGLFVYYFAGLVASRVGSLMLEPLLKRLSLVKFSDYKDYVNASKKDEKIYLLVEVHNSYRTMAAGFFILIVLRVYKFVESVMPVLEKHGQIILVVLLFVLFLVSYIKQGKYVFKRVTANSNS